MYKKPKLGSIIYFITPYSLTETKVAFVGKESFLIDEWNEVNSRYREWNYNNYNINWFTDFNKAKKALLEESNYDPKKDILIGDSYNPGSGYWEILDREDFFNSNDNCSWINKSREELME